MDNEAGTAGGEQPRTLDVEHHDGRLIIRVDTDGLVEWGRDITPAEVAEALEHMARSLARRGFVSNLPKIEHTITHTGSADLHFRGNWYRSALTVVVDGRRVFAFGENAGERGEWFELPPLPALGPAPEAFWLRFNPPAAGAPDVG